LECGPTIPGSSANRMALGRWLRTKTRAVRARAQHRAGMNSIPAAPADDAPSCLDFPSRNRETCVARRREGRAACVRNEHTPPSPWQGGAGRVRAAPQPAAMSSYRLLVCLAILGWSVRELARRLACHQTTVMRWTGATSVVPDGVATWLEALTAFHAEHPAPRAMMPTQRMHTPSAKVETKSSIGHDRGNATAVRIVGAAPRPQVSGSNPAGVLVCKDSLEKAGGRLQWNGDKND